MGSRTGLTCVRHTLCIINTTMWIVGCSILTVGLWLRLSYGGYATLLHQYEALSLDSLCLSTGVITFVITFFACCGAWFRSKCMLLTYFVLLVFVFLLQSLVAILVFAYREALTQNIKDELKAGIKLAYNETSDNGVAFAWDGMQKRFKCCGVETPSDWFNAAAWPGKDYVPISCCIPAMMSPVCGRSGDHNSWYSQGCFDLARLWFVRRLHIIGLSVLVVGFLQLFGLIASMLLYCGYNHKRTSRTYRSFQVVDT